MKKNIYYTFLCFFVLNVFMVHSMLLAQVAPESNPQRGMYLDHFLKILPSGEIDQAFSVLSVDTNRDGIFEREDAILEYCAQNHITYIAPYDMGKFRAGIVPPGMKIPGSMKTSKNIFADLFRKQK
ncbi:MAG: hypothetical protein IPJ66_15820 [Bacteroidetes bacterium]|nr:hypothetical protein [Bacteroidota bacterium]